MGWITTKKEKEMISRAIRKSINVYFRPICSPFIVRKDRNFEYHQKGSILFEVKSEKECMFVEELLVEGGFNFTVLKEF